MKFFVSARTESGPGLLAVEIEAEDFDQAHFFAIGRAAVKFGDEAFRITSVVEVPEIAHTGPIALGICLDRAPSFCRPPTQPRKAAA